jgi:hypothetical protein
VCGFARMNSESLNFSSIFSCTLPASTTIRSVLYWVDADSYDLVQVQATHLLDQFWGI